MFKKTVQAVPINKSFYALGTIDQIAVFGRNSDEAIEKAMQRVYEIDYKMSAFRDDSEIGQINRTAGTSSVPVSSDTFFVIKKSIQSSQMTEGCIDATIGPVLRIWRRAQKTNAPPDNRELGHALCLVNYKDILLGTGKFSVRLNYPGQSLDLGSIAKGYAADEVRKIFRASKIKNGLIDLGGTIIAMGSRPDGRRWRIGIQHPDKPHRHFIGMVDLQDKTLVTSGKTGNTFSKMKASRIIDTKTGYPVQSGLQCVTVVCENSIDADVLSAAAYALGLDCGRKLIESIPGADAVFITDDCKISITDGLKADFELLDKHFSESADPQSRIE